MLKCLLIGGFAAAIYNMRQVYVIFTVGIFVIFLIKLIADRTGILKGAMKILLVLLGAYIITAPQVYINYKNYKLPTPVVQTDRYAEQSLFVFNAKGLYSMIKADFYIHTLENPAGAGASIIWNIEKPENIEEFENYLKITTVKEYLEYVKKDPVYFIKCYIKAPIPA